MIPKILKNFNLFIDSVSHAGKVDEIVLPKLTLKLEEHRAGGMDTPIQLDMGMEKLECDFTLSEYDKPVINQFGLYKATDAAQRKLQFKGGLTAEDAVSPVVVDITGAWKEVDFGTWKAGDKTPLKVSVAVRYYKLTIDGEPLVEVDAVNMTRLIGGVDQLEALRGAIGL